MPNTTKNMRLKYLITEFMLFLTIKGYDPSRFRIQGSTPYDKGLKVKYKYYLPNSSYYVWLTIQVFRKNYDFWKALNSGEYDPLASWDNRRNKPDIIFKKSRQQLSKRSAKNQLYKDLDTLIKTRDLLDLYSGGQPRKDLDTVIEETKIKLKEL